MSEVAGRLVSVQAKIQFSLIFSSVSMQKYPFNFLRRIYENFLSAALSVTRGKLSL